MDGLGMQSDTWMLVSSLPRIRRCMSAVPGLILRLDVVRTHMSLDYSDPRRLSG